MSRYAAARADRYFGLVMIVVFLGVVLLLAALATWAVKHYVEPALDRLMPTVTSQSFYKS